MQLSSQTDPVETAECIPMLVVTAVPSLPGSPASPAELDGGGGNKEY